MSLLQMVRNDCEPTYETAPSRIEYLFYRQRLPDVSISPIDGSIVIVYEDQTIDGSGYGIAANIMDSNWNRQKDRFQINTAEYDDQVYPRVKHFPDGKFLVTWRSDSDNEIHGRIMDANGDPSTSQFAISENNGVSKKSEIAMFDDGTAVVVFTRAESYLKGRFVYSDGTMNSHEFLIKNGDVNYYSRPAVDVSIDQQSFLVLDNHDNDIYGAKYSKNDGSLITNYGKIRYYEAYNPGVAALPNGNMILVYTEASGSSVIKTSFYDQSSVQNTSQVEYNSENGYPAIGKARDNVLVVSYTSDLNTRVSNFIIDQYNNQVVNDWNPLYNTAVDSQSLDVHDVTYVCVWEHDEDIYGVKYNLKYPYYISGLYDISRQIDEDFNYDFSFNDPESLGLTYQVKLADGSDLPGWIIHSAPDSTQITGRTPTELSQCNTQTFDFIVTTSKSCEMTDSKTFQIQVTDDPIVTGAASLQDQTVHALESDWSYQFDQDCFNDPDNQEITYTSKQSDGNDLPEWLEFEPTTRTFSSLSVTDQCANTLQITVKASDHCSFLEDGFTITVENQEVIKNNLLEDQDFPVNTWFQYQFDANSFEDPENAELDYEVTLNDGSPKPDWLNFHSHNLTFNGIPDNDICHNEDFNIKITASDRCHSISDTFRITITNQDISTDVPLTNQNSPINSYFEYHFDENCFNDPENVELTYTLTLDDGSQAPSWLQIFSDNRTIGGNVPADSDCGEYWNLEVLAEEPCSDASSTFRLTSTNEDITLNQPLDDREFHVPNQFQFQFDINSFHDPENVELAYSATLADGSPLPDWVDFFPSNRTFSGSTLVDNCGESIDIKVTASEQCSDASDIFKLVIKNDPITHDITLDDREFDVHNQFQFQFDTNSFNDPENVDIVYSATLADGSPLPDWVDFFPSNRTFRGSTLVDNCGESIDIKVTASDHCSDASDVFKLVIKNDPITHDITLDDHEYDVHNQFQFQFDTNSFNDPENVDIVYSATLADGSPLPDWVDFFPSNRTFRGSTLVDNCGESIDIKVTASDHCSDASDIFKLVIKNDPITHDQNLDDREYDVHNQFQFQFDTNSFNDPENVDIVYSATLADGSPLPGWVDFFPSNRTFSGRSLVDNCGEVLDIKVTASDHCSDASDLFQLAIDNPAPVVNKEFERKTAIITIPFEYTFDPETFTNEDGTELTYTAHMKGSTKLPAWLDLHSNNRTFSGRTENDLCNFLYEIIVTADDGCYNASSSFYLELQNRKPIREKTFTDFSINVFEVIDYTIPEDSFSDPDGQDITLKAELDPSDTREWPSWLSFNAKTGRFYGNASSCGDPFVIVVYGVDPCTEYGSGNWTLTILDEPPETNQTLVDQTFFVNAYNSYQFHNESFIDPNGGSLDYVATLGNGDPLPDWLEFDSSKRKFTGIASGCTQTQTVTVTAVDKCTSSVSQDFRINLVNNPIYEDKGLVDQEMNGNLLFNYTFALDAFGDLDGENELYTYSIECLEPKNEKCPSWLTFQSKNRRFLGNTPNKDVKYTIKVYASDSCVSIRASSTFQITINKVQTDNAKSDTSSEMSTGNMIAYIILSLVIVICIISFFVYRYYLQVKYQRLWDGKTEFFTAKMPNENLYILSSSSSGSSFSSTESSRSDIEMQNQGVVNDEDRLHSDIEVSDMSNASDLNETDSSNSSSSSSSSSTSSSTVSTAETSNVETSSSFGKSSKN
ncbi:hypothetical protein M0813_00840 [Anaeramoeba flamelloides]|uniref:Dystroglycan-type cadherin-like domain-containing protein n=1 Tax=Anaeramoeba flamelloides TaxID=1746091 RepID=A0ABQ8XEE5_9EUKA|nr:hypothetical protein M0813_00840 [Anaeramoeba flamelloides]